MLVDYKDDVTGETFEVFFKNNRDVVGVMDNPSTGNTATRQFSGSNFKLVGAGFHSNDYPTGN